MRKISCASIMVKVLAAAPAVSLTTHIEGGQIYWRYSEFLSNPIQY